MITRAPNLKRRWRRLDIAVMRQPGRTRFFPTRMSYRESERELLANYCDRLLQAVFFQATGNNHYVTASAPHNKDSGPEVSSGPAGRVLVGTNWSQISAGFCRVKFKSR